MNAINPYSPPESDLITELPEGAPLASRSQRFRGALVDAFLGIILVVGVTWATGTWNLLASGSPLMNYAYGTGLGLAGLLVIHGVLLKSRGQTVGKVIVGTRIVSQEGEQILPLSRLVALRYAPLTLASGIPVIGVFISVTNALFIFRKDHLCLHDHLAKTKVIQVGSGKYQPVDGQP